MVSDFKIPASFYYLTDVLGGKVTLRGKKIGSLSDMIVVENGQLPEVKKIIIGRPFGDPSLIVPWDKVVMLTERETVISIDGLKQFEGRPEENDILLKDHILDKKVLDIEGREVEVVYDIKLVQQDNKLLVTDVNISNYRLVRRLGLRWLANLMYAWRQEEKDVKIPWQVIQPLPTDIGSFRGDVKLKVLKEKLATIHPADMADIIEELAPKQRLMIFNELGANHASDTLENIDPSVQREMVATLSKEKVVELINKMTPGQAADLLSVLAFSEAQEILKLLQPGNVDKIRSIIEKQEENAVNFTTDKFLRFTPDTTAEKARAEFYQSAKNLEVVMYIYVVDEENRLLGVLDIKELLRADSNVPLRSIMISNIVALKQTSTLRDAFQMFTHYDFRALPVLNEQRLLGVIPHRDVMNLKHRFWE